MHNAMSAEEMIRVAKASVIRLCDEEGVGTGFFVSGSGHVLTCHHVVSGGSAQAQLAFGDCVEARILARDTANDLAILKCDVMEAAPLTLADPTTIAEGQTVFALGHPLGLNFTVSRGVVSSVNRIVRGVSFLQTDVPLNPGNSGGPIVNERGEVLGVANWGFSEGRGLGFAVSVRHIFAFAAQVRVPLLRARAFSIASPNAT